MKSKCFISILSRVLCVGLFLILINRSLYAQTAYIPCTTDSNVFVINVATSAVTDSIRVGRDPRGVTVSPDGTRVYIANSFDNTVSVINTAADTVVATIQVGVDPYGIVEIPDGSKVYVANLSDGTVSVINTTTNTVTATITVGTIPEEPVLALMERRYILQIPVVIPSVLSALLLILLQIQ